MESPTIPGSPNDAIDVAPECLLQGCRELKRELCQVLGVLLPAVSAQQKAASRDSPSEGEPARERRPSTFSKNSKDGSDADEVPPSARSRGGLKKARGGVESEFAIDDLSLTLAVASLLKSLYVVLDGNSDDKEGANPYSTPGSLSSAQPNSAKNAIADADRLVTAIVKRREEPLDINDFLNLVSDKDHDSEEVETRSGSPDATLAKATMEPLRQDIKRLDFTKMDETQSAAWKDVDRGISLVLSIAAKRAEKQPPRHESEIEVLQPDGSTAGVDFGGVVSAIDRVLAVVPRLENQCVFLNDRQQRMMDTAQLTATINRMMRFGRMDGQRVRFEDTRYSKLNDLIQSIEQAGQRSLASQRAELSQHKRDRMEIARMQRAIERSSRGRMHNQEYFDKEEMLVDVIRSLRLGDDPMAQKMDSQFYTMTEKKEKEMFAISVGSRMSRLRRLSGQATYSPADRDRMAMEELEKIFDSVMARTTLQEQRAGGRASTEQPPK